MKGTHFTAFLLKAAFGIGIVIILNLFYIFSTQLVYEKPDYEVFCGDPQVRIVPQNQDECVEVGGQWIEDRYVQKGLPTRSVDVPVIEREFEGYCNEDYTCREEYNDARTIYERNFFVVLVVLGTLTLLASFILRRLAVVAPALSFGGVLALFIASVRYWSEMQDYLRVIILGIALVSLIWLGIRKFTPDEKKDDEPSV